MSTKITGFKNKLRKADIRARKQDIRGPFYETKKMFRSAINYIKPLSYEDWMNIDPEFKAAALYVQFYDQICMAWYKVKSFYTLQEDGVSTMMQYLVKNVPIIENDPKRFTPKYIYRVAYNCLYCICHDIKRDRERYEMEISNIQCSGHSGESEEFDLFDSVVDTATTDRYCEDYEITIRFWNDIDNLGDDTVAYVECLLSNKKPPVRLQKKMDDILPALKATLSPYLKYFM